MPIIMVSTKNSSSDRFWAKRQGANQYLSKPFKGEELIKLVKEALIEQAEISGPAQPLSPHGNGMTSGIRSSDLSQPRTPIPGEIPQPRVPGSQRINGIPSSWTMGTQRPNGPIPPSTSGATNTTHAPQHARPSNGEAGMHRLTNDGTVARSNGSPRPMGQPSGQPASQASTVPFTKLIPRRNENASLGWSNRLDNLFITDQHARELYAVIDGQKNIEVLSLLTFMSKDEMRKALRILLTQQRILLFEPNGRSIDTI
jgi:CheY-like chemotaxis protein